MCAGRMDAPWSNGYLRLAMFAPAIFACLLFFFFILDGFHCNG
jgi:hypothetical protein